MKTAIFWKTPARIIVFSEDSTVEPPLNIADYSGSHVQIWESVRTQYPDLALTEYDEFPRGRLIWDDNKATYFFYADEKILSDPVAVQTVLEKTGILPDEFTVRLCRDPHYRTK